MAIPSLGLAGLNAAQTFGCLIVVGSVAGGVVAFQLGLAFVATAVALGARPLAVAALPDLSRLASAGDLVSFRRHWDRTLAFAVFLLAPIAVGLSALAPAIARFLGVGEMSSDTAVGLLAAAIVGLSIAVLGEGVTSCATQAAYALKDAQAPLQAAVIRTLLLTAGLGVVLRLERPTAVVLGTGVAFSAGTVLSAWYLTRSTSLRLPGVSAVGRQVLRGVLLAAAAGLPALVVSTLLTTVEGPVGWVAPAAAGGAMLVGGYLGLQQLMARHFGWPSILHRREAVISEAAMTAPEAATAVSKRPDGLDPDRPASSAISNVATANGATANGAARPFRRLAFAPSVLQSLARPVGLVLLALAAVGPALLRGDSRWLAATMVTCGVLMAAARPRESVMCLALIGPVVSAFDLHQDTSVTAIAAATILTGTGLAAGAARARGARRRRIRLGVTGWSSVLAASLTALAVGLMANDVDRGLRLAVTIGASTVAFVSALDPLRDLPIAVRFASLSSLLGLPAYALLVVAQGHAGPLGQLLALLAAAAAGGVGLALITACSRREVSPGPSALCAAVALGSCGNWAVIAPLLISVWLVVRHWPQPTGRRTTCSSERSIARFTPVG